MTPCNIALKKTKVDRESWQQLYSCLVEKFCFVRNIVLDCAKDMVLKSKGHSNSFTGMKTVITQPDSNIAKETLLKREKCFLKFYECLTKILKLLNNPEGCVD